MQIHWKLCHYLAFSRFSCKSIGNGKRPGCHVGTSGGNRSRGTVLHPEPLGNEPPSWNQTRREPQRGQGKHSRSRGPKHFHGAPLGRKFVNFFFKMVHSGVRRPTLYFWPTTGPLKRRGARGSLPSIPHPVDGPAWSWNTFSFLTCNGSRFWYLETQKDSRISVLSCKNDLS